MPMLTLICCKKKKYYLFAEKFRYSSAQKQDECSEKPDGELYIAARAAPARTRSFSRQDKQNHLVVAKEVHDAIY